MKPRISFFAGLGLAGWAVSIVLAGCAGQEATRTLVPQVAMHTEAAPPAHHYPVSTDSPAAQEAFDMGLTLAYAFNYGAAERAFREAARLDPDCAMAWWGVALVNGPHINFAAVPPDKAAAAWEARQRMLAVAEGANEQERVLIDALAVRYAEHQPEDRRPLDEAYAAAMAAAAQRYPDSADVQTLYAESLMNLWPWDLWKEDGTPQPDTARILMALERAMGLNPWHPGANHLYIHAVEASPHPEWAEPAADRLRATMPVLVDGSSHLIHMPAHIYARVGRWDDVAESNADAMVADAAYRKENPRPGFFALYMMHNTHFYAWAAMMQGRREDALRAGKAMVESVPEEFVADYPAVADGFMIFVPEVHMRFGEWEAILKTPEPPEHLPYSRAKWRFMRGIALAALQRLDEAEVERTAFLEAAAAVPEEWGFGNNAAEDLLAIARGMLEGEIAAQHEDFETAITRLEEAVAHEDRLRYDEPPDWIQPVRHTLGAVFLRAGKPEEAETVYRADLQRFPENGWSLYGLSRALRLQDKDAEAGEIEARFEKAWAGADTPIETSCLCLPAV